MFIKVRYGNDEMILCNPHCIVSNLLASITARCGMKNSSRTLDLSDESGIYFELEDRKREFIRAKRSFHFKRIVAKRTVFHCFVDMQTELMIWTQWIVPRFNSL